MKNSPMQGIKYALAFIFGALYTSSWWTILLCKEPDSQELLIISALLLSMLGSILIAAGISAFLCNHWNE